MSWWSDVKNWFSRLGHAWKLAGEKDEVQIIKALRSHELATPDPRELMRQALHRSPLDNQREPGGEGPRKPFGLDFYDLRAWGLINPYVRSIINVRQRECASAEWRIVPDLEKHRDELARIRQIVIASRDFEGTDRAAFPEMQKILDRYKPAYLEKKFYKDLLKATSGETLTESDIRYRFALAYLELVMEAEQLAAGPRKLFERPNAPTRALDDLIRPLVQDILTLDQGFWELRRRLTPATNYNPNRARPENEILQIHWIDGVTMRPVLDIHGNYQGESEPEADSWEQWLDGKKVAGFRECDLMMIMQYPQTDHRWRGYGMSPLETLHETLMLDARGDKAELEELNREMYGGFLVFKGVPGMSRQEDMNAYRTNYESTIEGRKHLPMLAVPKDGSVDFVHAAMRTSTQQATNAERRQRWKKATCAVYDFPLIKLQDHDNMNRSTAEVSDEIGDRGLDTLLTMLGSSFTRNILHDPGFGLEKANIKVEGHVAGSTRKSELEILREELEICISTPNEMRAEEGKEPIDNGDMPWPLFKSYCEEKGRAMAQEEHGGGMEEGFGDEDGDSDDMDDSGMLAGTGSRSSRAGVEDLDPDSKDDGPDFDNSVSDEIAKALIPVAREMRRYVNGSGRVPHIDVEVQL